MGAERTGWHDEADSLFPQRCNASKICYYTLLEHVIIFRSVHNIAKTDCYFCHICPSVYPSIRPHGRDRRQCGACALHAR